MKKESITVGILITILCLSSFSAIAQETEELGGLRIAYIEISEEGTCLIGTEDVGSNRYAKGTLNINVNNTQLKPLNITLRDKDIYNRYAEHELRIDGPCIIAITSIDESNEITSEVTLDYIAGTYLYIELTNIDGYVTSSSFRQPSNITKEVDDWLGGY